MAMNVILFDDPTTKVRLQPFTHTRPVARIRVGIYSIQKKWENWLSTSASFLTDKYLQSKYPIHQEEENVLINGSVIPNETLVQAIEALPIGMALLKGEILAVKYKGVLSLEEIQTKIFNNLNPVEFEGQFLSIQRPYEIFIQNGEQIKADLSLIRKKRTSKKILDPFTAQYNPEDIFVEEGVDVRAANLNAKNGPIYIGEGAEIMEGSTIIGPCAIGKGARINMGARIWGDTTIGPYCKVGGEVGNSVMFGYSNKAHSGFIGNTVMGEWCNLGADTNTSNLKNNYKSVRVWDYESEELRDTDLQFCGLMMGDHSKSSINSMFNTGTVVGTCANIFGHGFPNKFIPSFTWGDSRNTYQLEKAFDVAERVFARKNKLFSEEDKMIFKHIFDNSEKYRRHR